MATRRQQHQKSFPWAWSVFFSKYTQVLCFVLCDKFHIFKVLRGVQDLSRCMTSGNQKYFGKSRQVSLGLLALRNFPFAIISMHFPQLQTPPPLGGGGEGSGWFGLGTIFFIIFENVLE